MTLTGVNGTLSSSDSGATIASASSPYPDLMFGWPTPNTNPYSVKLSDAMDCGANVPLTVALQTDSGSGDISFNLPTGRAGAFQPTDSTDVPRSIPDGDSLGLSSTLDDAAAQAASRT